MRSYWLSVLLVLLGAGPLQAQVIYACELMDTVLRAQCCCDDHDECADADCGVDLQAAEVPCCDLTVEVAPGNNAAQAVLPANQRVEVKSGVDPPAAMVALVDPLDTPRVQPAPFGFPPFANSRPSGSDTYLTTQRLRL